MTKQQTLLKLLVFLFAVSASIRVESQTDNDSLMDHAILCIYRPHKFRGSAVALNIKLNEQVVGAITSGLLVNYKIYSEGKISILATVHGQTGTPIQRFIDVENGKRLFLRINLASKSLEGVLELVSAEVAIKEISQKDAIISTIELSEDVNNPLASLGRKRKLGPRSASGFLLDPDGYIATNHHVVDGANKVIIRGVNGNFSNEYLARVVCHDKNNDLAIIKIDGVKFDSVPYALAASPLKTGEEIFTMGYPMTSDLGEEIKLTNGVISSTSGFQNDITTYQVSSPVQPGNSGGPLFDRNGNLAGVINAKYMGAENVSYAIKTNYLRTLVELCPEKIGLPSINRITGQTLPEQVSITKKFIFIVEVNKKKN